VTKAGALEIQQQFGDWQQAIATIISYTHATSPAGALVQLALALDELDSPLSVVVVPSEERQVRELRDVDEHRIERLIRSAIRAVQKSLGTEFESVRGIVQLYAGDNEESWLDNVPKWAQEGRVARQSEGAEQRVAVPIESPPVRRRVFTKVGSQSVYPTAPTPLARLGWRP
jgi:hypothetical protein